MIIKRENRFKAKIEYKLQPDAYEHKDQDLTPVSEDARGDTMQHSISECSFGISVNERASRA